jgi:hypothetical protein
MMSEEITDLSSKRILIVGIIRNGSKALSKEIETLATSFSLFGNVSFYIVESDSEDNTLNVLNQLKSTVENFEYTSLGNVRANIDERIARITYCRNAYVDYVHKRKDDFDFIAVADLDGVNILLNANKVLSCWSRSDWDVCTANQLGPYYDIYALRAENWNEKDCWNEARALYSSGLNPIKALITSIQKKQIFIPEDSEWIRVTSAFGGLAIYSKDAFLLGRYDVKTKSESRVSEHVPFNESISSNDFRIFINPKLTNFELNIHNDFNRLSRRIKLAAKYLISVIHPGFFVKHLMPELQSDRKG